MKKREVDLTQQQQNDLIRITAEFARKLIRENGYDFFRTFDKTFRIINSFSFEEYAILCDLAGMHFNDCTDAAYHIMKCAQRQCWDYNSGIYEVKEFAKLLVAKHLSESDFEVYKLVSKLAWTKLMKLACNYDIKKKEIKPAE